MSAPPAGGSANTTSATVSESKDTKAAAAKPAAQLEEDDEFEDFPIEGTCQLLHPRRHGIKCPQSGTMLWARDIHADRHPLRF
jgi:26 proteasome complex subunit DSS1